MHKTKGLAYEPHGEGQPVLIIHGSHVADAFLPLARETILTDRHQLIRYHRRGFARSDPHMGPFSIEEQAQDALTLLEALGVARVHVIEHSYGAVTALQLACEAPSAVHSDAVDSEVHPAAVDKPVLLAMQGFIGVRPGGLPRASYGHVRDVAIDEFIERHDAADSAL